MTRVLFSALLCFALCLVLLLAVFSCTKDPAEQARERVRRAHAFADAGKHSEASIEFQAALQKSPENVEALYGLARTLAALGNRGAYRETLQRVLRVDPDHPGACVELGELLSASGNYSEALSLARRVLTSDSDHIDARRVEARALAALGRPEEAREAWKIVLTLASRSESSYLEAATFETGAGERLRAREILERGIAKFPRSVPLLLALGDVLILEGDVGDAEAAIMRAEEVDPQSVPVMASRARFLISQGQAEEALRLLDEARNRFAASGEKAAELTLRRAQILLQLGGLTPARAVLEAARDENPGHPGIAATLADVLITEGRTEEARELLPLAGEFDPSGRIPQLLEARIHLHEGRSLWAMRILEILVAKGDLSVDTHFLFARALAKQQRWAQARREYANVLRRVPNHELARLDLATLLRAQEDYDGALVHLDALPPKIAESPRVRTLRAQILLSQGEEAKSKEIVSDLLQESPENPVLLKLLGDVERAGQRYPEAIQYYQRAQKLSPGALEPVFAQAAAMKEEGAGQREVVRWLDQYQEVHGETPQILNRIAGLYLEVGDLAAAGRNIDRSLQIDPNSWETRLLKAKVLLTENSVPKAIVELEEAIKLNPHRPGPYNALAEVYKNRDDLARAEETYQRLLDRVPEETQTANNLANLYLEQGRLEDGLQLARIAYAGAPHEPFILDTLGWALELAGRSGEAAAFLDAAMKRHSNHPEMLLHWGVNRRSLGKIEESEFALRRVLPLAPDSAAAAEARKTLGNETTREVPADPGR
jgi:tetratricopeptide (TPR) repeat protein